MTPYLIVLLLALGQYARIPQDTSGELPVTWYAPQAIHSPASGEPNRYYAKNSIEFQLAGSDETFPVTKLKCGDYNQTELALHCFAFKDGTLEIEVENANAGVPIFESSFDKWSDGSPRRTPIKTMKCDAGILCIAQADGTIWIELMPKRDGLTNRIGDCKECDPFDMPAELDKRDNVHWCTDRTRFPLMSADGVWHCLALNPK